MQRKVLQVILFSLFFIDLSAQNRWVDSVFNTLDRNAKVGQLFMIPASSYSSTEQQEGLLEQIKDYGPGGVYITGGGPKGHVRMINLFQKNGAVPMLVGTSAEWGLAQTMDSVMSFQKPMVASSWKNDSLVTVWGSEIAKQLKTLGFHINFAPNADDEIPSGDYLRYFSNDEDRLVRRSGLFTKAMKDAGLLSVAKHLPRYYAKTGSVQDTTVILSLANVEMIGLTPFQRLFENGIDGVLTSNLHFTMQNDRGLIPASFSQAFIAEIVKKKLNYSGLVFANVPDYKKRMPKGKTGAAELLAFETGNDVLLNSTNFPAAVKRISRRVKKDKALQQQLDASVRKILEAKFRAGLDQLKPVDPDNLLQRLDDPNARLINHQLAEASITVVRNENNFLPIMMLENSTFTCISIGKEIENPFSHFLNKYAPVETLSILDVKDTVGLKLEGKTVFIGIFHYAANLEDQLIPWINVLCRRTNVVLVHFGNPLKIDKYPNTVASIAAYSDQDYLGEVVPQIIFGAIPSTGVLPINLSEIKIDHSLTTETTDRFSYTLPEAVGLDSRVMEKIGAIMNEAIAEGATPGCNVLVARNGKVVYEKSAGWLTYDKKIPVTDETIYDLASLTKVSATLQTTMFMYEHRLIDLYKKASVYLPELNESNKKDLILKDILTHQAGLWPTIFFWTQTLKDGKQLPEYYQTAESPDYPFPVSGNIFASKSMKDSLWKWTIFSKMREKPARTPYDYRYSDVGSYILQHLAEKILNQPMDDFLDQNLYEPLGASSIGYLPLRRFPLSRIAPTENDTLFRKNQLAGYVHDQGAAMHGGIAGHAGLFGDANDLAKLGQLWLQKGHYGGNRFFKPETIELFTTKQYEGSRRGLGWDRPPLGEWSGPTSQYASQKTFGHTGFTGTCIWVDPEFNLVYVFLSNRVYPDVNNKLLNLNIRTRIHDVVYRSIFETCTQEK